MARAIWKGVIRLGAAKIPVKLYSAVEDRRVGFRLLHAKDKEPVQQHMVNPQTGDIVPYESVHRAYQTDRGDFIILEDSELEELEPEASRDIEITRFVKTGSIPHAWYDRPYYLGPDDNDTDYFALAAALRNEDREGIARWVMRGKEYVGALRVEGDYLMLITLRHAGEVVSVDKLEAPGGPALERRELDMAEQLVTSLEGEPDLDEYRDEFRDRVMELVEAKAEGKVVKFPRVKRKKTDESLAKMLQQSLKATGAKSSRKSTRKRAAGKSARKRAARKGARKRAARKAA